MRGHMKKCIRKAAAAVLSAALLVTSESPAFAQNIQQTAVPADVITEQSRLEDGIAQTGYISDSFSEKRQEVQKEDTEGLLKSAAEQLPGQYRTQQLPAVRNQGGYGTCWAFSTIACMEINLMKKGYGETDLSELQLIYFATHSVKDKLGGLTGDDYVYTDTDINYLMRGGNYEMAVNTLSDWLSAAREESAPYETAADVLDTGLSDELAYADVAHLQNYRSYNLQNMEDVKQAVMDYGAVGISYYAYTYSGFASNQYYNADTAGYYCYDEQTTNHAVTVVGWDDDYPAQNFPTAPEGNGAWIVRNSWGSDFGEDGYFYISYYDQSLSGSAVAFEAEPADNYDNNYQYDGSAFAMMTGKQQFKAANVFTAKANENGTEQIAAASFEVMAKQMDYTVSIYTGLTDVDNPESGELKAQKSGSFSSGDKDNLLKTVAFDEPVTVNQGEIFSVVAAFAGSGGQSVMLYYDCARTLNGIQANCAAQPHQSYIYLNEYYGWSDYGNTNNTNFRIKAFTNNVAEPDTAVTAVKLNKHALELNWQQSEQLTAEVLPENAANKNVIWTSSDSGVAEVSQEGVVTAKGAGSAVITVETEDGKMQDSCTVTVKKPITDIKITGTGELKAGDKAALSVVILPQDTTDDTTVVWTSSDTNIAAVDQNGLVTALSKGTVTITAKAGTHTAEHTLVITQAAPKPTESTTKATTEATKPTQKPTESTTEATTEAPKPTQKPTEATTEATKPTESTTEVTKPSEQPTETPTQKPDTEPTKPDTEEKVVYEMRQDAEGVWHYYANDVIAADYCGMACNEYGWWYIQNGDVNFTYTGMACNEYGWWYFNNGQLDLTFYGLANNEYGTWFYTNGQLNFGFTGMLIPDDRWLYVRNGQVLTDYTGMAVNDYG